MWPGEDQLLEDSCIAPETRLACITGPLLTYKLGEGGQIPAPSPLSCLLH